VLAMCNDNEVKTNTSGRLKKSVKNFENAAEVAIIEVYAEYSSCL